MACFAGKGLRVGLSQRRSAANISRALEPISNVALAILTRPVARGRSATMPRAGARSTGGPRPAASELSRPRASLATDAATRKKAAPDTMLRAAPLIASPRENAHRVLEERAQLGEERRTDGAVDDSVIARERHRQLLAGDDGAVDHHGDVSHLADREDRPLGRVDHRRERVDPEHAELEIENVPSVISSSLSFFARALAASSRTSAAIATTLF